MNHAERTENSCRLRVRYAETDNMGVVYYANYLAWFEVARTEHLRSMGADYKGMESRGIFLPVIEAGCRYLRPATYDDQIELRTSLSRVSGARLRFDYDVRRLGDELRLATGFTMHVAVDETRKPRRLPKDIWELFE